MNQQLSATISPSATAGASAQQWLGSAGIALVGTLFVAVCAHISLPLFFTPVPITLQPFAVLALGLLLPPQLAAGSLVAYLVEGAFGLPVFAPSQVAIGGMAHLFGPTGGYLLSYPVVAPLISGVYRRTRRGFGPAFVIAGAGSLITLACGATWFAIFTHAQLQLVLVESVVPFLPGDALKVAAAAGIAAGAARFKRRSE